MVKTRLLFILLMAAVLSLALPAAAQEDETVLSVVVSDILEDSFRAVADRYEEENPGVQIQLVTVPGFGSPVDSSDDVEEYLDNITEYVSSADILNVDSTTLLAAVDAGYILNLNPLIDVDAAFNPSDYHATMLNSFQWGGGTWGLPTTGEITILWYDPAAFDEAGLTYPTNDWTFDDLEFAARALTKYADDGVTVETPGLIDFADSVGTMFASLLGDSFVDDSVTPAIPNFENPALIPLMERWNQMQTDGIMSFPQGELNFDELPLIMGDTFLGQALGPNGSATKQAALLPGGRAGLSTSGYAISNGTQDPEAAYDFLKYLVSSPDVVNTFFGGILAQPALEGVEGQNEDGFGFQFAGPGVSPEAQAVIDLAIEQAIPSGETVFANFINEALSDMQNNDVDAITALDTVKETITAYLEVADARRGTPITVAHTVAPTLVPGEIALNFAATGFASPFPNEDKWQNLASEFAAQDSEVGYVNLDTSFPDSLENMATNYDCFYMPSNDVQTADLSLLRNIDPMMQADPGYDPNDYVTGALAQVQVNGQTWAIPIIIQPEVMRFNYDLFNQAGVNPPVNGWTVSEFEDALRRIKSILEDEEATPFETGGFGGGSYLLNLIAAYGGIPYDGSTSPATINFTDPATITAIQQVLDLAKEGLIQYDGFTTNSGNVISINTAGEGSDRAIYTETLSGFGFGGGGGGIVIFGGGGGASVNAVNQVVTAPVDGYTIYPTGSQFSAVSYDMGVAYISATTQYAEACYRFIRYISEHPDLYSTMPARQSMFNHPDLIADQGQENADFYTTLANLMSEPSTIVLAQSDTPGILYWLQRAFDRYVLEDADLEAELRDAELYTKSYQDCIGDLPPLNFGPGAGGQGQEIFQQINECLTSTDPTASGFFGGPG